MDDFLEFVDIVEEVDARQRMPKRYLRDIENPVEFYTEEQFCSRYRFRKATVVDFILPLIEEPLIKVNNRGLPFTPLVQLLISLRFYATGNYQVCKITFCY